LYDSRRKPEMAVGSIRLTNRFSAQANRAVDRGQSHLVRNAHLLWRPPIASRENRRLLRLRHNLPSKKTRRTHFHASEHNRMKTCCEFEGPEMTGFAPVVKTTMVELIAFRP
jgi:hypothetical protein